MDWRWWLLLPEKILISVENRKKKMHHSNSSLFIESCVFCQINENMSIGMKRDTFLQKYPTDKQEICEEKHLHNFWNIVSDLYL